jgi:sec-independent protein translocase protein TatA
MSVGPMQLLLILLIIVLLFGTKKLRNLGSDLGMGIKNFKDNLNASNQTQSDDTCPPNSDTKPKAPSADDQPSER